MKSYQTHSDKFLFFKKIWDSIPALNHWVQGLIHLKCDWLDLELIFSVSSKPCVGGGWGGRKERILYTYESKSKSQLCVGVQRSWQHRLSSKHNTEMSLLDSARSPRKALWPHLHIFLAFFWVLGPFYTYLLPSRGSRKGRKRSHL